ncbi:hypothetical protein HK104_009283 [Borealophlyctis nickersoniae]|nr:hypothetical protein HK104_009283 [Borealophlyctis nickersoniae]
MGPTAGVCFALFAAALPIAAAAVVSNNYVARIYRYKIGRPARSSSQKALPTLNPNASETVVIETSSLFGKTKQFEVHTDDLRRRKLVFWKNCEEVVPGEQLGVDGQPLMKVKRGLFLDGAVMRKDPWLDRLWEKINAAG